tara:strand:- start:405 stop:2156 length:1752 start_codon:yes stop_codon:yes gene_type:complete
MREKIITDFLNYDRMDNSPKKYLELPAFDKNYNLKKNIIFYKKWDNYLKKLEDKKKILRLHDYFLEQLTTFLNKYHNRNYSKRYWSIILGLWLFKFISSVSFRWNLISCLEKKKYIFLQKEIISNDVIPLGIEDYIKMADSNYWHHYIYTQIIKHSFSDKLRITKVGKITKNNERDLIYQKLKTSNIIEKLSLCVQKFFNFFPQNKNTLIFSTYMSNLQEMKLNLLTNKSLLFYKMLRPYLLFEKKGLFSINRKNFKKLKSSKDRLENFLSVEILKCLPSSYLENFEKVENLVNKIPFPKSPKKIFTTLGIFRSTLMDRYIARNVENGSSLILAQHGGLYFQEKIHFSSIHEVNISNKYLSWGNVKKRKVIPIGIIKNLKTNFNVSNKIILEVRKRTKYVGEIKLDSGFSESKKYFKELCLFFKLLKGNKICEDLLIKLHETESLWNEKKQFMSHNSGLKFLDKRKKMIKEINNAKLVIHTYCGTGHLESLSINKPTLIFFVHNLNLFDKKTKNYIKEFIKLGIIHRSPQSLFKMLISLENSKNIEKWWNTNKIQNLLRRYMNDYGFFNEDKISQLKSIINEK